jgi:PhnB protein
MATLNPYLNFNGNCEEAFTFYKSVFGGEFTFLHRFSEMPPNDNCVIDVKDENKIMHVSLPIGSNEILLGSDMLETPDNKHIAGNNFSISIHPSSREETDKLFNGLSEGGNIIMPLADTFWNSYFGMFTDKFGIGWMINYDMKEN